MSVVAHAFAEENVFDESRRKFEVLTEMLGSARAVEMTHSDLEQHLCAEGLEILRQLFQDHMTLRGPGAATEPVVGDDGIERPRARERTRGLESLFGRVGVERTGYGAPGAASLHPLDADLNLPVKLYTLGVRKRVAREVIRGSFDEAVQSVAETTGAHVPKRQAEELALMAAQDFDAFYKQREMKANESAVVTENESSERFQALTFDGKGVPMLQKDLRDVTRKAAETRQPKMQSRGSKGEKKHTKRMAEVASVYSIAPFVRTAEDVVKELRSTEKTAVQQRPRPEDKRVWASVEKEMDAVIAEAFDEAERRDPQRQRTWVALVDGNTTQLDRIEEEAAVRGIVLVVILDLIHVIEYLWKASYAFNREGGKEAERWVTERLLKLLRGASIPVAAGIRRSATLRGLKGTQRKAADKCADYLLKYGDYMYYDAYLEAGMPIATGVIEGACRYLVKDRMERTGARWGLTSAEAVLKLRALYASGDFEDYWKFHEQMEYERNHSAHYANNKVPAVHRRTALGHPHLKVVK